MKTAYDVILRPVITEKSMAGIADKKYVFEVATGSNKVEIRKAKIGRASCRERVCLSV